VIGSFTARLKPALIRTIGLPRNSSGADPSPSPARSRSPRRFGMATR